MYIPLRKMIFLWFCIISVFIKMSVSRNTDCELWLYVEDYLKENMAINVCEPNHHCTGLNCNGIIMGENFHGGIQIEHCKKPASIKLSADVPQLSIHHWKHSFVHGEKFRITDDVSGEIDIRKGTNILIVNLKLKLFSSKQQHLLPLNISSYLEKDILKDAIIPVPSCDSGNHVNENMTSEEISSSLAESTTHQHRPERLETRFPLKNCTIDTVTCSENEMCHQLKRPYLDGVCVCKPMYSKNVEGVCIYSPEFNIDDDTSSVNENSNAKSDKPGHTFLLPLLVTLAVVLLMISLIYAGMRFKTFDYLHRRFRVRVYEHVLLGQEEDNDDPLTDPVV